MAFVARGEGKAKNPSVEDRSCETSLLLRVPSAIVPEEGNILVNPRHPEARKLRVASTRPFRFDARLADRRT